MKKTKIKTIATMFAIFFAVGNGNAQTPSLLWQAHYSPQGQNDSLTDVELTLNQSWDANVYVCGRQGVSASSSYALINSYTSAGAQNGGSWPAVMDLGFGGINVFNAVTTRVLSSTQTDIYACGQGWGGALPLGDMLIAKYNKSGVQQWKWYRDNGNAETFQAIAVDQSTGAVYAAGRSTTNAGDIIVAAVSSGGGSLWAGDYIVYNTGSVDNVFTCMKLVGNNLYVVGYNKVTATNHDVVLLRINIANGAILTTAIWDNTALASDRDEAFGIDTDPSGNVYLVGTTQNTTSPGDVDGLLLKFTSLAAPVCSTYYNNIVYSLGDELRSIDVVSTSEIYVTGFTQATGSNNSDYLTMKYDGTSCTTMSNPTWVKFFDGTGSGAPSANDDIGYMVMKSSNSGKIFVTGRSYETTVGFNATTVRYTTAGVQETSFSYDRGSTDNSGAYKYPMELIYDACYAKDHTYIAGYTREAGAGTPTDATLVKYGWSGPCTEGPIVEGRMMTSEVATGGAKIYPNPFNGKATFISATETIYANASFIVFDIMGKEVKRMENMNAFEFEIDMNGFANGLYFYKYIGNEIVLSSGKFVISQ